MPDEKPSWPISQRARVLWDRLTDWYGTRLADTYGPFPPKDWCAVVDGASNDTVKRGLSIIRAEYVQYPPTFPQFARAMKPLIRPVHTGTSVHEELARYVVKHYWPQLTLKQQCLPWRYLYRQSNQLNESGKDVRVAECLGVEISQHDGERGYRITVENMRMSAAA